MHSKILKFIENVSKDEKLVNKFIVSLFIYINKIEVKKNKLIKSNLICEKDKEYTSFDELLHVYKTYNSDFSFEQLIELFEFIISPADKIVNGAVYTPLNIREYVVTKTLSSQSLDKLKIGDISCGCGGFLYTAALFIQEKTKRKYSEIFSTNLFGLDITQYSITRCKILLSLLAVSQNEDKKYFNFNLFVGNALNFDWNKIPEIKNNGGFDVILGNPPYVCSRNIEEETKRLLNKWSVNLSGHPDLYITFFQIALENIKPNGVLGFITVNTFFKSINGLKLREYFKSNKFKMEIIDFGGEQIFTSRTTYTCLCFIYKQNVEFVKYCKTKSSLLSNIYEYNYTKLKYSDLNVRGWILNSKNVIEIISKIEKSGKPLGSKYKIRTGIATLKNNIYKFKPVSNDRNFYKLLKDGKEYFIEKEICKTILNTNRITSNNNISSLYEKIIFPYDRNNGEIKIYKTVFFKNNFPNAFNYLLGYKDELKKRDKGNNNYDRWFSYGRNQSLEKFKYKLLFPHICSGLNILFNGDEELLFYNGMAIMHNEPDELNILKKILESKLFWFYIKNTSKPYSSSYFSLSKNYLKNFGIIDFSDEERGWLLKNENKDEIDLFILKKYDLEKAEVL